MGFLRNQYFSVFGDLDAFTQGCCIASVHDGLERMRSVTAGVRKII